MLPLRAGQAELIEAMSLSQADLASMRPSVRFKEDDVAEISLRQFLEDIDFPNDAVREEAYRALTREMVNVKQLITCISQIELKEANLSYESRRVLLRSAVRSYRNSFAFLRFHSGSSWLLAVLD